LTVPRLGLHVFDPERAVPPRELRCGAGRTPLPLRDLEETLALPFVWDDQAFAYAFRQSPFNVTGPAAEIEREQAGAQNFYAAIHTSGIVSG
jgi:hypothetical protein